MFTVGYRLLDGKDVLFGRGIEYNREAIVRFNGFQVFKIYVPADETQADNYVWKHFAAKLAQALNRV